MHECKKFTRREVLARSVSLIVSAAAVSMVAVPRALATKAAKSDFYYQETPQNGKSCSSCRMFLAQSHTKGQCAILEGEVVPTGWCMAYSERTS